MPPHARLGQLLYVVHHAVQVPLRVDLGASSVIEPGQALVVADVGKHWLDVARKRGGDDAAITAATDLLEAVALNVDEVGAEIYEAHRRAALARIERRDPDDWPILATAMALDCPVWTEDNDFFGTGVPTWTSDRVELYLAEGEA